MFCTGSHCKTDILDDFSDVVVITCAVDGLDTESNRTEFTTGMLSNFHIGNSNPLIIIN